MTRFVARLRNNTAIAVTAAVMTATALTPAGVATADDDITAEAAQSIGNSAFITSAYEGAVDVITDPPGTEFNGPLQNKWLWIGYSNPEPPPGVQLFELQPILLTALLPGYVREFVGWLTRDLNWEVCALGASVKFGPYGSITGTAAPTC